MLSATQHTFDMTACRKSTLCCIHYPLTPYTLVTHTILSKLVVVSKQHCLWWELTGQSSINIKDAYYHIFKWVRSLSKVLAKKAEKLYWPWRGSRSTKPKTSDSPTLGWTYMLPTKHWSSICFPLSLFCFYWLIYWHHGGLVKNIFRLGHSFIFQISFKYLLSIAWRPCGKIIGWSIAQVLFMDTLLGSCFSIFLLIESHKTANNLHCSLNNLKLCIVNTSDKSICSLFSRIFSFILRLGSKAEKSITMWKFHIAQWW